MAQYKSTNNLGSGIFQYTAGNAYKTVLGGSFTTSIGPSSAVATSVDNKFTLGTANSFKYAIETAVSFGKKFEYKDLDEIEFKKGSISILEHSAARCLELFQGSAGLGLIQRGAFEAQRAAAKTAMVIMATCDVFLAVQTIAMSGFGTGFATENSSESGDKVKDGVGWANTALLGVVAVIPAITAFASTLLTSQKNTTEPAEWNPNAVLQASSSEGIFIGAAVSHPPLVQTASYIKQDGQALEMCSFSPMAPPSLQAKNVGLLDKKGHITGYDMSANKSKSYLRMEPTAVTIQTSELELIGLLGGSPPAPPSREGSKASALFASIDLTAQQAPVSKAPPNASLVLDASADPKATLTAGAVAPANSSVELTPTALNLKSGAVSSLALTAASAELKSTSVTINGSGQISLESTAQIQINGKVMTTIAGFVRLG